MLQGAVESARGVGRSYADLEEERPSGAASRSPRGWRRPSLTPLTPKGGLPALRAEEVQAQQQPQGPSEKPKHGAGAWLLAAALALILIVIVFVVITGLVTPPGAAGWGERAEAAEQASNSCQRTLPRQGEGNGGIFLGLSLSQHLLPEVPTSNRESVTRQAQLEVHRLQDHNYTHVCATSEEGWLAGGEGDGLGAAGAATWWKLAAPDSAHIKLVHIGSGDPWYGGLSEAEIVARMSAISFEPIRLKPLYAALTDQMLQPEETGTTRWELVFETTRQLAELQAQLRRMFGNPSSGFPDRFYVTLAEDVKFHSKEAHDTWQLRSDSIVSHWRQQYPDGVVLAPPNQANAGGGIVTPLERSRPGGLYLFNTRNVVRRYFPPTMQSGSAFSPLQQQPRPAELRVRDIHSCNRPVLQKGAANGCIFLGLSLSMRTFPGVPSSNNGSVTRQTQYNLSLLTDRNYSHFCSSNNEGWLVGGGEGDGKLPGSATAWKFPNPDTAHVEIMHVFAGDEAHGGLDEEEIIRRMRTVHFKPIMAKPLRAGLNSHPRPHFWLTWEHTQQIRDLQDQMRRVFPPSFEFAGPTGPPLHTTIMRGAMFYSPELRDEWLERSNRVVEEWRRRYPGGAVLTPDPAELAPAGGVSREEIERPGGIYLHWTKRDIRHYFPPTDPA